VAANLAVDAGAPAKPKAADSPPRPEVALVEQRVVSDGPYSMRVGFQSAPVEGSATLFRMLVDDARGAVADARIEVTLHPPGGHGEAIPVLPDPADGSYLAEMAFRSGGRHHLEVSALPKDGRRMISSLDFDVAAAPRGAATPPPKAHRPPKKPGDDDDDDDGKPLPTTVIPPDAPTTVRPHAIGPAPQSANTPPSRPPSNVIALPQSPVAAPVQPPADEPRQDPAQDDPYKYLDRR
jgi:hypothetical protein